ncbi:glycerol-3-phosphate acyltransferase 2, mitochondrial isoform X1 [Poecilia reticulata]|uniref:glycerol-3-phosphate acyltransferase 2, mitochondrial isoform X1 n=1 Tax=Poecilia reticulata TaxID=8081 RepID=UPI0004A4611A|nr:PREDICTED: glycerol-3-phosphate acyltransferase 2, mitochondrial isoform X1 [Poecilia reticulata]XP_008416423.1 PREDICTED: glycerol-3-phosphate acyltransferase 2, mitochondrial isoform X1 [Poecilia reticulata]
MMVNEKGDGINNNTSLPPIQQYRPALSWELKIKKHVTVPSCLGMFRPVMGQCCHQCTPNSLVSPSSTSGTKLDTENRKSKKLSQNSFLGFRNLLSINETQTRYRGWLVRRVCCVLYVSGCKVYGSPVSDRQERVCQSNRVREALAAVHKAPEGEDSQGQHSLLSPLLSLINTCISPGLIRFMSWVMLKMFASVFGSIQVNKNHLPALHKATQEGSPLVYVYLRQSALDCTLIPLALLCHSLRTPYTVCPLHIKSSFLRSILEKVGVILLPPNAATELEAEMDPLYSAVMTSLVRELLHEGQALSVGVSAASGHGGQWLARIRQLIKEESVPDVSLVPVGISYDCVANTNIKEAGSQSVLQWLLSLLWKKPAGSLMIHLSQPFSLKEMCESGRCRVDEWLPLQDLLLPVVINNRADSVFGKRRMSWLLPTLHSTPELEEKSHSDRDLSVAIVLHLIFSAASCTAVMSTSLVSSLLLYKHSKGVSTSVLCRDVAWLLEELLFRNRDVGFGGTLPEIIHYSLALLAPHLLIAALPSRKDPLIVPRPSAASVLHLSALAQKVTHTFIMEAVGACAVSAMLCEVVFSGVSSRVRSDGVEGEEVKGDMEFDVVLGQSELTEKALQLCHLLPPGIMPPCQSAQSFALDAVDSLVRCGILIMEEIPRDIHICDFWKREGTLTWTATDDPYHSDSDCEDQDLRSYKISQPKQCPEMLFFLCRMLAGHLRALCWTTSALDVMDSPLPEAEFLSQIHSHLCETANQKKRHYESCSEEAAHTAVRTLIDLGVLLQTRQTGAVFLGVSPLFQLSENREKLQRFISQYLYN